MKNILTKLRQIFDPIQSRWRPRSNLLRDLWLLAVTLIVLLAINTQHSQTNEIQEGRKATTGITCAISNAVVGAGRIIVVQSAEAGLPPKLESFLEEHGYPDKKFRQEAAKTTALGYSDNITKAIVKAAGTDAKKVLEPARLPDGKPNPVAGFLNCQKLRQLANLR